MFDVLDAMKQLLTTSESQIFKEMNFTPVANAWKNEEVIVQYLVARCTRVISGRWSNILTLTQNIIGTHCLTARYVSTMARN